jgi:D-aminopeptidase
MGIMAFTPMGNAVTFNAAVTPPTPVRATSSTIGGTQYRVHNTGNVVVYMGYGDSAANATSTANASLNGTTISLMPNSVEVFTFNANAYFTGATGSGTAVVTIIAGDGS